MATTRDSARVAPPSSESVTLRAVLSDGPLLSATESLRTGAAILAALAKAEEHRVTGVTPDQVFLSPDRTRATVVPTVSGGAGAQSGTGADCTASLVWSAGAILLEMLTGEPFQADRPLPDLRVSRPDVPHEMALLVYRMLDPDPDLRVQTLEEAVDEISQIAGRSAGPVQASGDGAHHTRGEYHGLPDWGTCFVGRDTHLTEIRRLFTEASCRLLTLVGPGGAGKSRLAVEAARMLAAHFQDGVFFIPLQSVSSPAFIGLAIAAALGLPGQTSSDPISQVCAVLANRHVLLVLDDFDEVIEGATTLCEIVSRTVAPRLLVTSRQRLGLQSEWLLDVGGLSVPVTAEATDAAGYPAIQLFLHHAVRVTPEFSPSPGDLSDIARICHLLDGLPLGIELAASWARVLSPGDIVAEMGKDTDFLATASRDVSKRHHSMRATFDRSWALLDPDERAAARRLSVFAGGFTREAAEQITATPPTGLAHLLDKSVISRTARRRYGMHGMLRRYLAARLDEDPEEAGEVRHAHVMFYASFIRDRCPEASEPSREGRDAVEDDVPNILQAWDWAVASGEVALMGEYAGPLCRFHHLNGWFREGVRVVGPAVERLRAMEHPDMGPEPVLGSVMAHLSGFHLSLGDHAAARSIASESLQILRAAGMRTESVVPLRILGHATVRTGGLAEAEGYYGECLDIARDAADRVLEATLLNDLGKVARLKGNHAEAEGRHRAGLEILRRTGRNRHLASCLNDLGSVTYHMGEYDRARQYFEESLALNRELADRPGTAAVLNNLGNIEAVSGDHATAGARYRESLQISRDTGNLRGVAYSLYVLGELHGRLGDHLDAKRLLEESVETARRSGDRSGLACSTLALGSNHLDLDDADSALHLGAEGLAMFRAIGSPLGICQTLQLVARAELARGADVDARQHTKEALVLAIERQLITELPAVLLLWARLLERGAEPEKAHAICRAVLRSEPQGSKFREDISSHMERLAAALRSGEPPPWGDDVPLGVIAADLLARESPTQGDATA